MTFTSSGKRFASISALSVMTLAFGSAFVMPAQATEESEKLSVQSEVREIPTTAETDRFIVKFSDKAEDNFIDRYKAYGKTARDLDLSVKEVKSTSTGEKVISTDEVLSTTEANKLIDKLEDQPDVESVEPDLIMQPLFTPNDTHYQRQWHLYETTAGLNLPQVWDKTTGEGQVVAVIDTGITAHSDLSPNVLPGYDMITSSDIARDGNGRDANPQDEGDWVTTGQCNGTNGASPSSWHGTHVAGSIAAITNNAKGVAGAAPGAKIVPIRALGACGGYTSDIVDGLTWASGGAVTGVPANANPAKIINMSLGGSGQCSTLFQNAINAAVDRGSAVFVASGNSNVDAVNASPANCNNVIAIAASGREGDKAAYSNYGSVIDVTAPGGDMTYAVESGIASTLNSGSTTPDVEAYSYSQGTSMATPLAASVGALMLAADPSLTPAQIESRLKETARPLAGECAEGCGAGLIDASKAVVFPAAPAPEPAPEPEPSPEPAPVEPEPSPTPVEPEPSPSPVEPEPSPSPTPVEPEPSPSPVEPEPTPEPVEPSPTPSPVEPEPSPSPVEPEPSPSPTPVEPEPSPEPEPVEPSPTPSPVEPEPTPEPSPTPPPVNTVPPTCPVGTVPSAPLKDLRNASVKSTKDVVAVDSSGRLWNYPGTGNGGLKKRIQIGRGWQNSTEVFVADWNNDGVFDLVSQWKDGKLKVYLGKINGGFTATTLGNAGWASMHTTVGKFCNGLAYPQIVSKDTRGNLWLYKNESGNKLSERVRIGSGWQTLSKLTMVDFDNDGNQDIIAKNASHNLFHYRTDGQANFIKETRPTVGRGWNVIRDISVVEGFSGAGSKGFITTVTDGSLRYYDLAPNKFSSSKKVGAGWHSYRITR